MASNTRRRRLILGGALLAAGILVAAAPFVYIELTERTTQQAQGRLREQFAASLDPSTSTSAPPTTLVDPTPAEVPDEATEVDEPTVLPPAITTTTLPPPPEVEAEQPPDTGDPVGRIVIEGIGADWVIVEGTDADQLAQGPGHMFQTPVPGQPGNAVVSAHRTTYGAPFRHLDQLEIGDRFWVETTIGVHVFEVAESFVVPADNRTVALYRPGVWLTLTTCDPPGLATHRLIVVGRLVAGPNLAFAEL